MVKQFSRASVTAKSYERRDSKSQPIYGFVAVMKLVQIAGFDDRLHGASRRILMILAGYCGQDGMCFPSMSNIAKHLCVSRQAVIQQVNKLIALGYVVRRANYSDAGGRVNNSYFLNIELAIEYSQAPQVFSRSNDTS